MKKKRRLISALCCVAAIGILIGIYSFARIQNPTFIIIGFLAFLSAAAALFLSIRIYIRYLYK